MSKPKSEFTIVKELPKQLVTVQATNSKVISTYVYCQESTNNFKKILGNVVSLVYVHKDYFNNKLSNTGKCERSIFLILLDNKKYIRFSSLSSSSFNLIDT